MLQRKLYSKMTYISRPLLLYIRLTVFELTKQKRANFRELLFYVYISNVGIVRFDLHV